MLKSIAKLFRINDWWNYIFPPIIGIVFFLQFLVLNDFNSFIVILALFSASIIGTASYGFFLNDITDSNSDQQVGKRNFTHKIPILYKWFLLISTLIIGIIPWFFLPFSAFAIALYVLQLILLTAYSAPPLRFKQNIYTCIISDALYSSVIPLLISIFIFSKNLIFSNILLIGLIVLAIIFLLRGIRNILLHQIKDINKDSLSEIKTLVMHLGANKTALFISNIILPIEIIFTLAFVIIISFVNIYFIILIPAYAIYIAVKTYEIRKSNIKNEKTNPFQLHNDFYEDLLPLFFIIMLSISDWHYLFVLGAYFILFRNKILALIILFIYKIVYRKAILWVYYHPVLWLYYKGLRNKYVRKYIG